MSWDHDSEDLIRSVPRIADSLEEDLAELSDVQMLWFEGLVKSRIPNDKLPSAVDGLLVNDMVTFVEFKRWIGERELKKYGLLFSNVIDCIDDDELLTGVHDTKKRFLKDMNLVMEQSVQKKAIESLHVYERFFNRPDSWPSKTRFILVDNNGESRIGSTIEINADRDCDSRKLTFLKRYGAKCDGESVFFDEVRRMSPREYVRWIKKNGIGYPQQDGKNQ